MYSPRTEFNPSLRSMFRVANDHVCIVGGATQADHRHRRMQVTPCGDASRVLKKSFRREAIARS
jgi:hypothetical protein